VGAAARKVIRGVQQPIPVSLPESKAGSLDREWGHPNPPMPQLEHFRIKVFRAVAEHLSFRKGGRTRKEALAYSYPAHFRPQAIQSTALNLSLDKQEQMQYCLVKVLATVSPVRPSFLQAPALHPENDRFFTPLFSASSESLFSQLLCFHIYLRCPIVFFATPKFPSLRALCAGFSLSTLLSSAACRLFVCSLRVFFAHASFVFSRLQPLSQKHPGGVPGCNRGTLGNVQ
jgi:hypothetical protein